MSSRFRSIATALTLASVCAGAHAQQGAYRFELTAVRDSTISFTVGDAPWVKAGLHAIVVDPARRDVLVARVVVTAVSGRIATAVVTGQTTPVTLDDVALIEPPRRHWYEVPAVWIGTALGVGLGLIIAR